MLNPAFADQVFHPSLVERRVLCAHYDRCIEVCLSKGWPEFSCSECQDYEFERPGEPDYWNDQAVRCRDLLQCAGYFPRWLADEARRKLNELKNSACDPPEPVLT